MKPKKNYSTKARSEIDDFIKNNSSTTVSANDIIEHMDSIGLHVYPTTVYRYLQTLCDQEIIIKFPDSSGNKSVYQYSDKNLNCDFHLHLKCTECGKIIHLNCSDMEQFKKHIQTNHKFNVQYKGSIIYGKCEDCIKKDKQK